MCPKCGWPMVARSEPESIACFNSGCEAYMVAYRAPTITLERIEP